MICYISNRLGVTQAGHPGVVVPSVAHNIPVSSYLSVSYAPHHWGNASDRADLAHLQTQYKINSIQQEVKASNVNRSTNISDFKQCISTSDSENGINKEESSESRSKDQYERLGCKKRRRFSESNRQELASKIIEGFHSKKSVEKRGKKSNREQVICEYRFHELWNKAGEESVRKVPRVTCGGKFIHFFFKLQVSMFMVFFFPLHE